MIFGIFVSIGKEYHAQSVERSIRSQVFLATKLLEEKLSQNPENSRLMEGMFHRMGKIQHAKVWLVAPDGGILARSFRGPFPAPDPEHVWNPFDEENHRGKHFSFKQDIYVNVPILINGRTAANLHYFYHRPERHRHERAFMGRLALVFIVIALLIIPVTKQITNPLKKLKKSANRFAEGDLSHRVAVKGCDEFADLGRTFNSMAEKLEGMIRGGRELLANVSHELRSPLARMRVASELMEEKRRRGDEEGAARHQRTIEEEIDAIDTLLGRLLAFSRYDLAESPTQRESIILAEKVEKMLDRISPLVEKKRLELSADLDTELRLEMDPEGVETVLSNLLGNAVKYTPEQGRLRVSLQRTEQDVVLEIINTSPPIQEDALERIFEPFVRAEHGREAGVGLGLAIAKKVIDLHGGAIAIRNVPDGVSVLVRLAGRG